MFAGRVAFGVKTNLFLRNSHIPCAFTPLSLYADPHGGTDSNTTIAYNVTIVTNRAVKVDIGGKTMIIAG